MNPNHEIAMNSNAFEISRRQKADGPNHHLWDNHGTWWFHATIHPFDGTAKRVRVNLQTRDLSAARRIRDQILAQHATTHAA